MPNIKSAKKRMDLSEVARGRNRGKRSRLRNAVRQVLAAEDRTTAEPLFRDAVAILDREAGRRLMHPNRAGRIKSRLARHLNALEG